MTSTRLQRVTVLEALERLVKQFRTHEAIHPLRVPGEPLDLDAVLHEALGIEARRFEVRTLRSRGLLQLGWPDGSLWEAWVIVLPSRTKLYCDSGAGEVRILASGGRNEGDQSDRLFLELFGESRGDVFGIEMDGGLPSRVRSSIDDREFLIDVFVNLFEGSPVEADLRGTWADADGTGFDLREDVGRWLRAASAAPFDRGGRD